MSYLALARKWRPNQFDQVVGQAHVLTALENALKQNRLHHAYLFSGTRGVGKTSIGRLFAKGLNCETGITATPCGECATCREIDEGRFVDLLEIDAASRTKVEDTRELLDNVQYKPARGRFKVYLIDEVHMLSRHSFNALLKTLEEPPEYVKFLLATTDPQKLPVTILSRCLQFHLKPIGVDQIHEQLDHILAHEQVTTESRALGMISHAADGSMRDALSLTDQAIALGNGVVNVETVANMLGTLDTDQAIHLLEAISKKSATVAMDKLDLLAKNGVEWDGLLQQLAAQLHRIAMYQALPATLDKAQPDAEQIEMLSQVLSAQDVQLYYQIALKGRQDIPLAPTAKMGVEMVVLRMMAFKPAPVQAQSLEINVSTAPAEPVAPRATQQQTAQPAISQQAIAQAPPIQPAPSIPVINPRATQGHAQASQATESMPKSRHPSQAQQPSYERPPAAHDMMPPEYAQYDEQGAQSAPPMGYEPQMMGYEQQNNTEAHAAEPQAQPSAPAPENKAPMSGLRHQLRSKRGSGASAPSSTGSPTTGGSKKASATPANKKQTAIERIAQRAPSGQASRPQLPGPVDEVVKDNEPYQWKAIKEVPVEVKKELTPSELKRALEHIKTPEMALKLAEESLAQDHWAALANKLETAKMVEQLALNSSFKQQGSQVQLTLRQSHAHLNTEKAQQDLAQSLSDVLGEACELTVSIGEDGQTPLELREALYQGKLQQAHQSLNDDHHVQFIQRRFAAELDRDSVRPI
ncbi:DNA polymerase III subunit gamma/tau [Vibrio tapetis]|uniref:DNA polymerase III subunit gamma/tau n=1 Tax=Vibrio tapetis subsp. tapetis TaxID=1671868 RepID=A0A2N8ZE15_9VIBR|nr:DNA polymerase III subunit gamma/tau [Vibrio tapetis]SON50130.1 DNA polymerase III subunits gamma and tau [Vibrio tapetis subsp. tapetis]